MNDGPTWVTGAGGLIGSWLVKTVPSSLSAAGVRSLTRSVIDLADFSGVRGLFDRERPRSIVHCAALSRSTDCEADPALARRLNLEVTVRLAELAGSIPFVFFSTDLVFDGRAGNYDETAAVNPLSVYAETKAAAELTVLTNPRHTVVRTSLNGGPSPTGDRGFDEQLRKAWQTGRTLRLFVDEFRSPMRAEFTARAVWELVAGERTGLFHIAGAERLSRWEIGRLVAQRCPELQPKLEAASLAEYVGAPRAPDTSLNCAKAQSLLSFALPRFSSEVAAQTEPSSSNRSADSAIGAQT
jgi:dTDP-4-dehydrorhamnose reductase